MLEAPINGIIIVVVFSVLIIVHEFGHFIAARLFGVKVTDFSIGFGPPLFKRKIKQTNFLICVFPLGGFIKMAGDNRAESRGYRDEFFSKPPGIRSGIVLAGPLFNYVLAFIILTVIATIGFPVQDTVVGAVRKGSPAQQAGIRRGDELVTVGGKKVRSWSEFESEIREAKGPVRIGLKRNEAKVSLDVPVEEEESTDEFGREIKISQIGLMPYGPVVGEVIDEYPAQEAGIKTGDEIIEVNGETVESWQEVAKNIQRAEEAVLLRVKRNEEVFSLKVAVKRQELDNPKPDQEYVSVIGIRPPVKDKILKTSFPFSLAKGGEMLFRRTSLSIKGLWYMITDPSISFRDSMAGPIYISYMISKTASVGFIPLLQLVSLLSIFLCIVNLFPVPVLDGGHIIFFSIEKLKGKPLSQKTEDTATRIGLVLLGLLMFFVFYNDITKRGPMIWEEIKETFVREGKDSLDKDEGYWGDEKE